MAERRRHRVGDDDDPHHRRGRCLRPHPVSDCCKQEERYQCFEAIRGGRCGAVDLTVHLGLAESEPEPVVHRRGHNQQYAGCYHAQYAQGMPSHRRPHHFGRWAADRVPVAKGRPRRADGRAGTGAERCLVPFAKTPSGSCRAYWPLLPAAFCCTAHTSSSRQKLRRDRACFAQRRVPAWASPSAQVPRPEHMRRSTNDAAPSRRQRYAIRRFLLTDSVAYASRGANRAQIGLLRGDFEGARASSVPSTTHPPVVHRTLMFSTSCGLSAAATFPTSIINRHHEFICRASADEREEWRGELVSWRLPTGHGCAQNCPRTEMIARAAARMLASRARA